MCILENAPLLIEAAKVTTVTSEHPELRYTVGDDAASMLQAKRKSSKSELYDPLKRSSSEH